MRPAAVFMPLFALPLAAALVVPGTARATVTSWLGSTGDWGNAAKWSAGEPTAGDDAEVPNSSTVQVTLAGETCANLTMGATLGGCTLHVMSGALNVVGRAHIADTAPATLLLQGGTLTAAEFRLGNTGNGIGSATVSGGTLNAGTITIGDDPAGSGTFSTTATTPLVRVTGNLYVKKGGSYVCGAGTLNVGTQPTDGVFVDGAFSLVNKPTVTLTSLTLTSTATLSVTLIPSFFGRIDVAGPATLDGKLLVGDVGMADGTYEVLRANPLQGTFSSQFLPANWSWRVEGNSLLLTKGPVPVTPTSWGRIKADAARTGQTTGPATSAGH